MVDAAVAAGVSERTADTWLARYRDGADCRHELIRIDYSKRFSERV